MVDEIGDVLELEAGDFEATPEVLPAVFRDVVLGVYKLPQRLLLLLDIAQIVTFDAQLEARPARSAESA